MRKIDAFAHILPRAYLERQLEKSMVPSQLTYYCEGVFTLDPVLAVPPLEEVGPLAVAAELARRANDELAALVRRFPVGFAGFAAALPQGAIAVVVPSRHLNL